MADRIWRMKCEKFMDNGQSKMEIDKVRWRLDMTFECSLLSICAGELVMQFKSLVNFVRLF